MCKISLSITRMSGIRVPDSYKTSQAPQDRALASDALYRYCNAILKNCNAIFDFQITLFSISNNAIFDFKKRDFPFLMTQFLLCHKYTLF